MQDYKWESIKALSDSDKAIDLAAIRPLYQSWRLSKERLMKSSEGALRTFTDRLIRRMSVETGILERIYDLDRGTTEALITKGFVEDIVSRSSTNIEPSRLIDILRDQESAIKLVMDCIAGNRELTKGVVHELHVILTKHQDTTTAVDAQGNRHEIPLIKGKFKLHPNNPKRPDGSMHEYCPPIHVDSEMEKLIRGLNEYKSLDPIIVAAWLHHRFTQIHPYQDGNGRVARVLMTMVLLRADLLPLVVDRDLRTEYINTLESADRGDLAPLCTLLARLERAAILQALSVDVDAEVGHERTLTGAVLRSLTSKLDRRRQEKEAELRNVNTLAQSLRTHTRKELERTFTQLGKSAASVGEPEIHIHDGGPDCNNAHWFKYEVVKSANAADKFANFSEDHYFVKATIRVARERLVFVVSFHHVGRELTGIMEATAFARLESFEESDERGVASQDFFVCSIEPLVFAYQTKAVEITPALTRWLDSAIAVAIKEYGDRL